MIKASQNKGTIELVRGYLFVGYTLTTPSIDAVERAVATLDDGRVRVLINGRVLKGKGMTPVGAIVADGDAQRCTWSFLGQWERGKVVVYKHMSPIT
jgi:hypothetical protein